MSREDLAARQTGLSPAKRALLERWKRGEAAPEEAPAAGSDGPIGRRADAGPAPLSSAQQRLWFLDQLAPGNPAYNVHALARLTGRLDRRALAGALAELVRRHEILRTVLRPGAGKTSGETAGATAGEPAQVVLPRIELTLPSIDLAGLPAVRREGEARERAGDAAARGFDLARAPLLALALLRLGDGEHLLLLVLHHAIADGWSLGILLRELAALYEAFAAGAPSPLPPLPLQYADFAVWQRRRLAEGAYAADLAFWRAALAGAPESPELPTDRSRPARPSLRGADRALAVDEAACAALAAVARQEGATLFMALLAVFATLLSRSTGQRDLLVGTPVAGRPRRELEGSIGLFVNTVVLRGELAGDPTFRALLGRVRGVAVAAFGHQELPFERLVEELHPDRDPSRNPLFQVMLAFQNTPVPEIALRRLTLRREDLAGRTAMLDLALSLGERAGALAGGLRYSTDLFDAATADRLAGHFGRLLASAAAAPERRLSELPMLSGEEERQLLAWNDTAAPPPAERFLHRQVAAIGARLPDAPAAVCGEAVLTYGELDRRSGRLARRLRRLGVGPDVPVGLCVGRSPAMLVGILGILKAGGAYVPLDGAYPPERLALMVADAGAPVLVADGERASALALAGPAVLRLDDGSDEGDEAGDGGSFEAPEPVLDPDHLAYVIYTSGSTGRPKGVACTHRSAVNLVANIERYRPLQPGDASCLWTSISFDVSVSEIFGTLGSGGVLHVPADEERMSAEALLPWIARHRIASAYLPPFLLADFASWVREGGDERRTLRCLWAGVEPIREGLLAEIRAAVPGLRIVNGYGPTEATVCDTLYEVGDADLRALPAFAERLAERRTPLGRPIGNCRIHLLGADGEEVPVGVHGEMWIAGTVLARGYLGRPELTAERFVPDPVGGPGAELGGRCYRTGDLARRLPTGDLEFIGRRDQQVKLRGFRIELGEVEASLGLHPEVREAVAAVREDGRGGKHLVAWVVPQNGAADASSWREHLARRLPAHMVPTVMVPLAALPLTPSGKVDRRALPDPDWDASCAGGPFVAPAGAVEPALAAIWSELLGGGPISAEDDFFARGGHSLLATRVVSRVRERFAVELPLRDLFEARTLRALGQRIAALGIGEAGEGGAPPARLGRRPRGVLAPLSFGQQRLWFMDQLDPGSVLFNTPGAVRLQGRLAPALLERILAEVVRRHEVLRTSFPAVDGQPVQVIAPELAIALPEVDLAALPAAQREAEVARRIAADLALPFDLARGPLLRATLLRLAGDEHVLLLNLHHIAADRWSQAIFRRELAELYGAWSQGLPSPLSELPLQYADFALWQRRSLAGDALAGEVEHWRCALAGAPHQLELPTDRPRPQVQSSRGRARPVVLPAELAAGLAAWGRRRGGTPFMVLLAALGTLLGRAAGQEDLLVGSPIAGRERRELEGLIGLFVNTLVLRVELAGDPSFDRLLDRVRAMALAAYAHQSLPFERLVDELAPVRELGRSPLFQVAFALQNVPAEPLRLPGLTLLPLGVESGTAQQDLLLLLAEEGGALAGFWEFAADLFDDATIDRLSGHLATLLAGVLADSGRRLSELPLLSPGELQQALREWSDTAGAYPGETGVAALFAAEAALRPAAPAVLDGGETWSYERLDEASSRLAVRLRALGVGEESRVGIAMQRSAALVVGLLAILKAGGAYVPLDPDYPDERLAFLVADAGLAVALVDGPTAGRLAGLPAREGGVLLCLVAWDEPCEAAVGPLPLPAAGGAGLAYVTYTSGSTGRPKGVAVPHRAIVRLVRETAYAPLGRDDRVAHASSVSFDAATFEIWGALLNGGAVVVIDREAMLSPADLAARLRERGVTTMFLTTALFNRVVGEQPGAFASLRHLLVGGEAMDPAAAARALAAGRPGRLVNAYGPTESTTFALWSELRDLAPSAAGVPIGRPLANTTAYVLDRWDAPAAAGRIGELLLGGDGLARGYLDRPELTAERFVPHPWSAAPGDRLYRTGDLARRRPDGAIEFVGRIDQQVKIRGFRIEPGEIESALAEHPAVAACAVALRGDLPGGKGLVAYLVARGEVAAPEIPPAQELRAFLAARLPAYMVPAAFVALPALPLSPHGKVDRAALPAPGQPAAGAAPMAPRTPVETALAAIWSQVLGRPEVGVHDNFFELGGDSIVCVQVVSRARRAGLPLTPRDLFQNQTIAELAAVVAAAGATAGVAWDEPADGEIPLTPIQRWFLDSGLEDPHHFNQSLLLEPRRALAPRRLERALDRLVRRHAALGVRFRRDERGRHQITTTDPPAPALPLGTIDLAALPPVRRRGALEAAAGALQASLDLGGPLLRAALFELAGGGQRLLLAVHHLIVDAVSWRVLVADLEALYGSDGGEAAPPPPAGASFRQWAALLAEQARSPATAAELGAWLDTGRAAQLRPLPVDHPGGGNTVASARTVVVELEAAETRALLEEVPAVYRTRVADTLLAALVEALAGWTGEPRLLVDLESHGREELAAGVDPSRTVGWLTAVYPQLLELDRRPRDPGERLKVIKEQLWSVPRGGIGYGLLRHLGDEAIAERLRALPAPQVLFNYLGDLDEGAAGRGLFARAPESAGPERSPRQRRGYLLEINGGLRAGRLRTIWTYSAGLHERSTIQALADRFAAGLRDLVAHVRARPETAAVLTPADFPQARVSQRDLDKLVARIKRSSPAGSSG